MERAFTSEPAFPHDRPELEQRVVSRSRAFYWSVRRELWEHRSLHLAPLSIAAVVLFSSFVSALRLPGRLHGILLLDPARQRTAIAAPYSMAAAVILFTGFLVAVFYCIDALSGERRDRSILFWKSMPVSDRMTVFAKVVVPALVLPLLTFAVALAAQVFLLVMSSGVLVMTGTNPGTLWMRLPLVEMSLVMFYGLFAHVLWYAPIYGWLLMISAWSRRAPYLWAVLPFVAAQVIEKIVFGTSFLTSVLKYRLVGAMTEGFVGKIGNKPVTYLSQLDPVRFIGSPGLWSGLVFALAFLFIAAHLRRHREPV
jgi:ABC-2 type transport system permease protein